MAGNTPLHFTRLRAPYRNAEHLRLRIYRSTIFSAIGKWFGMPGTDIAQVFPNLAQFPTNDLGFMV